MYQYIIKINSIYSIFPISIFWKYQACFNNNWSYKNFSDPYLRNLEAPYVIKLNKIIRNNKPLVALFAFWEILDHKIQVIILISNIANAFLNFVTLKNENGANFRITHRQCNIELAFYF